MFCKRHSINSIILHNLTFTSTAILFCTVFYLHLFVYFYVQCFCFSCLLWRIKRLIYSIGIVGIGIVGIGVGTGSTFVIVNRMISGWIMWQVLNNVNYCVYDVISYEFNRILYHLWCSKFPKFRKWFISWWFIWMSASSHNHRENNF